jgi:MerR family mercuric resistance operon transcriptional regulator
LKTKDVLARAEIDRETLRFYERKGLLPQIKRTNSGYRVFPEEIITRLQFIKTAKCAGFTLTEIRELVELKQIGATCKVGRNIASEKREELDEKMKALKKMKKVLNHFIEACEANGEAGLKRKCHLSFETLC